MSKPSAERIRVAGFGHALGSDTVHNEVIAEHHGLAPDWYNRRTGIIQRRVSANDENALTLAQQAVERALNDAGLFLEDLGQETVLIHIQNGWTHMTPPAGVVLAASLGLTKSRVCSLDGVCAEPITALEIATLMLCGQSCSRVIISSSVDFLEYLDPTDRDTAGLFGSGAGAVVLTTSRFAHESEKHNGIDVLLRGIEWETHASHWHMGDSKILSIQQNGQNVTLDCDFYTMRGQSLFRIFLEVVPPLILRTLDKSGWTPGDVNLVLSHQPNPRMLELSLSKIGLSENAVPMPGRILGNMGPASLLVNLSLAYHRGDLIPKTRILLLAFGLGFSCGAATLEVADQAVSDSSPRPRLSH